MGRVETITYPPQEFQWRPDIPQYQPEISLTESQGGQARHLWKERLTEFKEIAPRRSQILSTGIGGGVAKTEKSPRIWRFGDHSEVPAYLDLEREFGQVPEMLFLVASPKTTENVLGLRGLARHYKEQGVKGIIAVLTGLAHERQDHQFYDEATGNPILQVTTLKEIINLLASQNHIDGGLLIGGHSMRPIELGLRLDFPLLPIDTLKFLISQSDFTTIPPQQRFVMGPDKGRRKEARQAAAWLKCPLASAQKTRARSQDGYPTLSISQKILNYLKDHRCHVIAFDDEIREGGTIHELANKLDQYAQSLRVCVNKAFFAGKAINYLRHPLIKEIIVTDAVEPLTDITPIRHKLRVISLKPEINHLIAFLQKNFIPDNPDWLRDPSQTGSLLELDLRVERYEEKEEFIQ